MVLAAVACCIALAGAGGLAYAMRGAQPAGRGVVVSQRDRTFWPSELSVVAGDTVAIVNDDGQNVHHAYSDDPGAAFDSGDQSPGSSTPVTFARPGTFQVMCGIHPKMRLTVKVEPR